MVSFNGRSRKFLALGMAGALALSVSGGVGAADTQVSTVIKGCVNKETKVLRISVHASKSFCGPNQSYRFWNAVGPTGPKGATGPIGPKGATGATGLTGATGPRARPAQRVPRARPAPRVPRAPRATRARRV